MRHILTAFIIRKVFTMSRTDFDCSELDEYTEKMFQRVCKEYPQKAELFLKERLEDCKSEAISRSPYAEKKGKYKKSKHLKDSWKTKVYKKKTGHTFGVLRNTAPHSHLAENGHVAQNGRWVEGKHMLENTMTAQQPKIDRQIEKLVDDIFDL